jgi:hypothetical protein
LSYTRLLPEALSQHGESVDDFVTRLASHDASATWRDACTVVESRGGDQLGTRWQEMAESAMELMHAWASEAWPLIERDAMAAIQAESAHAQWVLSSSSATEALRTLTQGVEWVRAPAGVTTVVAVPSLCARPWVMHEVFNDCLVVVFPVADGSLPATLTSRPRSLRRLQRTFRPRIAADVIRLLLMRGPRTPSMLAADLGTTETRVRLQLLRMRAAGLLTVDAETHEYRLRDTGAPALGRLLDDALSVTWAG